MSDGQTRLVVVDGIAYPLRYGYEDSLLERTTMLHLIANRLRFLAFTHHVAVSSCDSVLASLDVCLRFR